jgi:predicted dithiol-disulfide oxidoreductase (DUF899 family)
MTKNAIAHPHIASRDEWLAARKKHLEHEKELSRRHDRMTAERRRLPMVSYGTDFNYDFHVTLDESITPIAYNYGSAAAHEQAGTPLPMDEQPFERHGLSVFFRADDDVYHTYSAYARGVEGLTDADSLLDTTPYGRQEDWEDSPPGWSQKPTYG